LLQIGRASKLLPMRYFLKLVGLSGEPLREEWWVDRPEIVHGIYFGRRPKDMDTGDLLIYYAVGGSGRLCGVATLLASPSQQFTPPATWDAARRQKFPWRAAVQMLHKCAVNGDAPRLRDFHDKRVGRGSYQRVEEEKARKMIDAIANRTAGRP
jgi:hypothetical protein